MADSASAPAGAVDTSKTIHASTALAREFETFRRSLHSSWVRVPATVHTHAHTHTRGYALTVRKCRVRVPHALASSQLARAEGNLLGLRYHLSLWDSRSGSFFGRTFRSHTHTVTDLHTGFVEADGDVMYMVSSIQDDAVLAVLEAVLVITDSNGRVLREFGAGWCTLTLFAPTRTHTDVSTGADEPPADAQFHTGTPRALLCLQGAAPTSLPVLPGAGVMYNFQTHRALLRVRHLVADSEVFGALDMLPGLAVVPVQAGLLDPRPISVAQLDAEDDAFMDPTGTLAATRAGLWMPCMAARPAHLRIPQPPVLAPFASVMVKGLRVYLPPGFEQRVLATLAVNRNVDLGLAPGTVTPAHLRIVNRVVTLTVHNGHTEVSKATLHVSEEFTGEALAPLVSSARSAATAALAAAVSAGAAHRSSPIKFNTPFSVGRLASAGASLMGAETDGVLTSYAPHSLMAIIISLEYVLQEPTAFAMGVGNRAMPAVASTPLIPSNVPATPAASAAGNAPSAPMPPTQALQVQPVEQHRHVLIATQTYVPASPAWAPASDANPPTPPKVKLALSNRENRADPDLENTFTRRPLEVPLHAPNPHGRLTTGIWLDGATVEQAFASPLLQYAYGSGNVVVGAELELVKPAPVAGSRKLPAPASAPTPAPPLASARPTPSRLDATGPRLDSATDVSSKVALGLVSPLAAQSRPAPFHMARQSSHPDAQDAENADSPVVSSRTESGRRGSAEFAGRLSFGDHDTDVAAVPPLFRAGSSAKFGDASAAAGASDAASRPSASARRRSVDSSVDDSARAFEKSIMHVPLSTADTSAAPPPDDAAPLVIPLVPRAAQLTGVWAPTASSSRAQRNVTEQQPARPAATQPQHEPAGGESSDDRAEDDEDDFLPRKPAERAAQVAPHRPPPKATTTAPAPSAARRVSISSTQSSQTSLATKPAPLEPSQKANRTVAASKPEPRASMQARPEQTPPRAGVSGAALHTRQPEGEERGDVESIASPASISDSWEHIDGATRLGPDAVQPMAPLQAAVSAPQAEWPVGRAGGEMEALVASIMQLPLRSLPSTTAAPRAADADIATETVMPPAAPDLRGPAPPMGASTLQGAVVDAERVAPAAWRLGSGASSSFGAPLSRGVLDTLVRATGIPLSPDAHGERVTPAPNLDLELSDALSAQRFSFTFATFSPNAAKTGWMVSAAAGASLEPHHPRAVFFSFQLGAMPIVRTAPAALIKRADLSGDTVAQPSFVLSISEGSPSSTAASCPSVTIDYDPTTLSPNARQELAEYLAAHALQIDCWDADALLPIGVCYVQLRTLLRQQRRRVQTAREFEVVSCMDDAQQLDVMRPVLGDAVYIPEVSAVGRVVGKLVVVMQNDGYEGTGRLLDMESTVQRPVHWHVAPMAGRPVPAVARKTRVKAVARPLVQGDARLAGLVSAHGSGRVGSAGGGVAPVDDIVAGGGSSTSSAGVALLTAAEAELLQRIFCDRVCDEVAYDKFIRFVELGELEPTPRLRVVAFQPDEAGRTINIMQRLRAAFAKEARRVSALVPTAMEAEAHAGGAASYVDVPLAVQRDAAIACFEHAQQYVSRKTALHARSAVNAMALEDDPDNDMELDITRGEARLASALLPGESFAGRVRHTLQRYFQTQLTQSDWSELLSRAPAAVVSARQRVADDRAQFEVISYAALVDAVLAPSSPQHAPPLTLKAEVVVLLGKLRTALEKVRSSAAYAFSLQSLFLAADLGRTGSVSWREFAGCLLRGMRVSAPDESGLTEDGAALAVDEAVMRRQLLRASMGSIGSSAPYPGGAVPQAQVDADREAELALLTLYREGSKRDRALQMLRDSVTAAYHLYAPLGNMLLVEYTLQNPYTHEERFEVRIDDPFMELTLVHEAETARYLRSVLPLACPDAGKPAHDSSRSAMPAFDDTMTSLADKNATRTFMLLPGERATLMFTYQTLREVQPLPTAADQHIAGASCALDARLHVSSKPSAAVPAQIPVSILSTSHGTSVALLRCHIHHVPAVVHRTLRFVVPDGDDLRSSLELPNLSRVPHRLGTRVHSTTPSLRCTNQSNAVAAWDDSAGTPTVKLRYHAARYPGSDTFHVILFHDALGSAVAERWRIIVQTAMRHDVHAVVGQRVECDLVLRGGSRARRTMLAASHSQNIAFGQRGAFTLLAGTLNRLPMTIQASTAGTSRMLVNLVDIDSTELVAGWMVTCTTAPPAITKVFKVNVPVGRAVTKKFFYLNEWPNPRTFQIISSAPAVVMIQDPRVTIAPRSKGLVRFEVGPVTAVGTEEVLLFVNDDTGRNEETLLVQLTFM